jgi:hypothetical protein
MCPKTGIAQPPPQPQVLVVTTTTTTSTPGPREMATRERRMEERRRTRFATGMVFGGCFIICCVGKERAVVRLTLGLSAGALSRLLCPSPVVLMLL